MKHTCITTEEYCSFKIPGKPIGKMRPRAAKIGGFMRIYTPKTQTDFEGMIKILASQAMHDKALSELPIRAEIHVSVLRPKSMLKRDAWRICAMRKPDIDNVSKTVLDACNSIVYGDDSQVVDLVASRRWGDNDYVEVQFYTISETNEMSEKSRKCIGVIYHDDALVVDLVASKRYGAKEGCHVSFSKVTEEKDS